MGVCLVGLVKGLVFETVFFLDGWCKVAIKKTRKKMNSSGGGGGVRMKSK